MACAAQLPASILRLHDKLVPSKSSACLDAAAQTIAGQEGSLPRMLDALQGAAAETLARCRQPTLLPRSTLDSWRAPARWGDDWRYLASLLPVRLPGSFETPSDEVAARAALVAAGGRLEALDEAEAADGVARGAKLPPLAEDPSGDAVDGGVATAAFLHDESAVYFARWMGADGMASLRADASPVEPLLIDDGGGGDGGASGGGDNGGADGGGVRSSALTAAERRYFRLTSAGVASTLHFDDYHNVFAQLRGSKRFWLLPPTAWAAVRGFPKGHDRYRQSPRAPIFEWGAAERRNASLGLRAVTLEAGDVLYIPPLWYHQTLTLARSAAVNVWSPSAEAMLGARAAQVGGGLRAIIAAAPTKAEVLCTIARFALAIAVQLARAGGDASPAASLDAGAAEPPDAMAADATAASERRAAALLRALHSAQHAHLRSARRKHSESGSPCPVALDACVAAPLDEGVASHARLVGAALGALPDGVRELTLADWLVDAAEFGAGLQPAWPGERGRATVLQCVLECADRRAGAGARAP